MAKLSRTFSDKRLKSNPKDKSTLIKRMSSRKETTRLPEHALLGDLFLTCDEEQILDLTSKNELVISRARVTHDIKGLKGNANIFFDGIDNNINIVNDVHLNLGLNDFTIDWWEYKLPIPKPNPDDINVKQYSFYKNSIDRKQPILIKTTDHKSIYLSSDGDHWDIADDKFMGVVDENKWTHWVIARSNDNLYTFKNGIIKNIWMSDKPINGSDGYLTIGSGPMGNNFYGYINNFRLVKNQALWTEEFNIKKDLFY